MRSRARPTISPTSSAGGILSRIPKARSAAASRTHKPMALGNWDSVIEWYGRIDHGRYEEVAQRMLSIAEEIQKRPTLKDVIPGTSLLELFLLIPEASSRINVVWDHDAIYKIYLNSPSSDLASEVFVKRDEVAGVIDSYITALRENSSTE